jgi:ABC-type branched-subunit amino acid transport system substrate-binding protein
VDGKPRSAVRLVLATALTLCVTEHAAAGPRTPSETALAVYSQWQVFTAEDGLPSASVRAIHVDGADVWVGTDGGLALRNDDGWRGWTAADGLPSAAISAIDVDPRTGDVWLGTWGGGLVRFTAGRFDRFTQFNSGLAGDLILAVAVVEGRVWAASNGGVNSYEPPADRWVLYLEPWAEMPETAVTDFFPALDGVVAGTWSGPLLRYDAGRDEWTPVAGAGEASTATAAGERSLWRATRTELLRRAGGRPWEALPLATGDATVHCLAVRSDGEAWLGTDDGLIVLTDWAGAAWVTYRRAAGDSTHSVTLARPGLVDSRAVDSTIPDNRIRCLAFQGDDVWAGTPHGLARGTARTAWRSLPAAGKQRPATQPSPAPEESGKTTVRIGVLGAFARPITRSGADSPWPADTVDRVSVERAVDRANDLSETPGRRPFAVAQNLYTFASYSWGTSQDSFWILRDRHDVRGLIGYIEQDARIDTAVALRTEVPVVNVAPTEPTADEVDHPWIFRCGSNDPRRQRLLLDHVLDAPGRSRLAAVRTPGPEMRIHLDRWAGHARTRGHELVAEIDHDPRTDDPVSLLEQLRRVQADAVLTWTDAPTSATLLRQLRAAGWSGLFVGSDRIVDREFVTVAGTDPGAVIALGRCPHFAVVDEAPRGDHEDLRRRLGASRLPVSPHAARSFDATMHLLVAIELGGPEREAIREALGKMERATLARLDDGAWTESPLDSP